MRIVPEGGGETLRELEPSMMFDFWSGASMFHGWLWKRRVSPARAELGVTGPRISYLDVLGWLAKGGWLAGRPSQL